MKQRSYAYIWVTWITGLLAGDRKCWGAAWYKAHTRNYTKRQGSTGLDEWIREHDEMVTEQATAERAAGFEVRVEDENKLSVKGEAAILGAKPDLIRFNGATATIIDCKTGRQRESDFWQVLTYMLLAPSALAHVGHRSLSGELRYRDGSVRSIPANDLTVEAQAKIVKAIKRIAQAEPLPYAPSEVECKYCDIADCKERSGGPLETKTDRF